jgi:hypothetical protein
LICRENVLVGVADMFDETVREDAGRHGLADNTVCSTSFASQTAPLEALATGVLL